MSSKLPKLKAKVPTKGTDKGTAIIKIRPHKKNKGNIKVPPIAPRCCHAPFS